ncbi:hypothetical protein C8J57DRAFT_1517176 [Mycena rebaudengoi]|nr:hypothetical protein C8J57DRAFT_1517176 [Mycena rebaudengoi]
MVQSESEDTASSKSSRSELRCRISELDTCIQDLEKSLAVARGEREKLQSRLDDDYKYPILALPAEITSEIFTHFLPIYPLRSPLSGLLSPTLLGQICRIWREIAFDTPRLWRAIEIDLSEEGSMLDAQLDALTTWLSRSKNCPLSLSFEIEDDFESPIIPRFTAALSSQSARWEHINLSIPFDDLHWLDRPFPLLRDLTLAANNYAVAADPTTLFQDTPALKSVVLTSITATSVFASAAADILREATALENFTCAMWGNEYDLRAVPPLIQLESLILRDEHSWPGKHKLLLDALTAPALRHLTISERRLADESISTITAFLTRSRCSLQSLHVNFADLSKTAARYLTTAPHLYPDSRAPPAKEVSPAGGRGYQRAARRSISDPLNSVGAAVASSSHNPPPPPQARLPPHYDHRVTHPRLRPPSRHPFASTVTPLLKRVLHRTTITLASAEPLLRLRTCPHQREPEPAGDDAGKTAGYRVGMESKTISHTRLGDRRGVRHRESGKALVEDEETPRVQVRVWVAVADHTPSSRAPYALGPGRMRSALHLASASRMRARAAPGASWPLVGELRQGCREVLHTRLGASEMGEE